MDCDFETVGPNQHRCKTCGVVIHLKELDSRIHRQCTGTPPAPSGAAVGLEVDVSMDSVPEGAGGASGAVANAILPPRKGCNCGQSEAQRVHHEKIEDQSRKLREMKLATALARIGQQKKSK